MTQTQWAAAIRQAAHDDSAEAVIARVGRTLRTMDSEPENAICLAKACRRMATQWGAWEPPIVVEILGN